MEKIVYKDFRPTRELKLPISGITVIVYPSLLVGDLEATTENQTEFEKNISLLAKTIKEWNFYEKESDEKPAPITVESVKKLPSTDFEFLANEVASFASAQKKS